MLTTSAVPGHAMRATDPARAFGAIIGKAHTDRQTPGQLFIHELAHAWQIDTATFLPGLMCDAVAASATTIGGNMEIYRYGAPDQAFADFNPEQQASIVDGWFAGSGQRQSGFGAMNASDDKPNPYFRYIRDNVRRRLP